MDYFPCSAAKQNTETKEKSITVDFPKLETNRFAFPDQVLLYPRCFDLTVLLNQKGSLLRSIHFGQLIVFFANLTMLIFLLNRWLEGGHFPLSNLYESLIFLSWSLTSINLWVENRKLKILTGVKHPLNFVREILNLNFVIKQFQMWFLRYPWLDWIPTKRHQNTNEQSGDRQPLVINSSANRENNQPFSSSNAVIKLSPLKSETLLDSQNLSLHWEPTIQSKKTNKNDFQKLDVEQKNTQSDYIFGGIILPIALLIHAFASFSLPSELRESTPLVPALQSNWLIMHVTVIMLSYAALLAGCLFSFVFLLFDICLNDKATSFNFLFLNGLSEAQIVERPSTKDNEQKNKDDLSVAPQPGTNCNFRYGFAKENKVQQVFHNSKNTRLNYSNYSLDRSKLIVQSELKKQEVKYQTPIKNILDDLSYKTISIGFLFLTVGIFSGAVWANEAWGSYWSWDPKETWALITWLIFAIYLHARLQLNWPRKKVAIIACTGFVVVWICYLGVNLLGQGLHSYGFLKFEKYNI
jgi:cytochrome c-type biogenesis protein CcsB